MVQVEVAIEIAISLVGAATVATGFTLSLKMPVDSEHDHAMIVV